MLLLHGFGADLNNWMFNQPALCEGRRTFALELPGHGLSSKDVGAGDAVLFTDMIEAALMALDVERLHVVGHSMGGALAVSLTARRPERIATLTLLAPAGLGPRSTAASSMRSCVHRVRKDAAEALQFLVHDASLISRVMVEDLLRYKRLDGVALALLETIARAWFPQGRQAVNLVAALRALAVPVQVIWGRDDRIIPAAHAEAAVPPARVHVLEGVGHLPHMEKAGEVHRLIRSMIG